MSRKIIHIIFSPFTVTLFIAVIIIYLLPPYFYKYEISLIKKIPIAEDVSVEYVDLNNDGFSEKIEIGTSLNGLVQLRVLDKEKIIDQWNFKGKLLGSDNPIYGDINADGLKEIMIFTYHDGQIFLNAINPFTLDTLCYNKIISPYEPISIKTDCGINLSGFVDGNNDGFNEIYFSTSTGYSIKPRTMFSFDYINDILYTSNNGCNIIEEPVGYDIDNDGKLEFFGTSAAVGNGKSTTEFSDHFSWLMVFDGKMNFEFEPIQIGCYPSRSYIKAFNIGNKKRIIIFNTYSGDKNHKSYIALYDCNGEKVKEKIIASSDELRDAVLFQHTNDYANVFLIQENGLISKIDSNLNIKLIQQVSATYGNDISSIDLDSDSTNESILFLSGLETAIIFRHDFSSPAFINVHGAEKLKKHSLIHNGKEKPVLYLEFNNLACYYIYGKNPFYNFKYSIYAGIYGVLFLFIWGIQKAQQRRVEQKFETEKEMASLQLKAIKNQVDPHFTLNIINAIGSLNYKNDTDKADYVFGK